MKNLIMKFFKDDDGASMVEYALLVALIAVVCMGAIGLIGTNANTKFSSVATSIGSAGAPTP